MYTFQNLKLFVMNKVLCILLFLLCKNAYAQESTPKQPVEVKLFEYIYEKDTRSPSHRRIILLQEDSAKALFKKSFISAFNEKWHISIPDVNLTVKQLPLMTLVPKFKTKIENRDPEKWYLFFQVFDAGWFNMSNPAEGSVTWQVKFKLVNGRNDSVIADRNFTIEFERNPEPAGQMMITRFPAYPDAFYKAFDSVAALTVLNKPGRHPISLDQAIIFNPDTLEPPVAIRSLNFKIAEDRIVHEGDPSFTFIRQNVKHVKTATKKNVGGNIVGGAVTLITGLGTEKRKRKLYTADYHFTDGDQQYHCFVEYTEEESASRERIKNEDDGSVTTQTGDMYVTARYIDTSDRHYIVLGNDTVSNFNITYYREENNFTQMWNGYDTNTVVPIPFERKTLYADKEVMLTGDMGGRSFSMYTSNYTRRKMFTINGQPAALILGHRKPEYGKLYQHLSDHDLKLITLIASLPYEFFNRGIAGL